MTDGFVESLYLLSCFPLLSPSRHWVFSSPVLTIQKQKHLSFQVFTTAGACLSSLWFDFLPHGESSVFCLSLTFSAFHGLWASLSQPQFLSFFTWWLYFSGKVKEKTHPSASPPQTLTFPQRAFGDHLTDVEGAV